MSYEAEISRANPVTIVVEVDQSESTRDPVDGNSGKTKAEGVSDAFNTMVKDISLRCAKTENIRDYFRIGVISYGGDVRVGLDGDLAGQEILPISEIARKPLRVVDKTMKVEDGAGGLVEEVVKVPQWFLPRSEGDTPMCEAISKAKSIIEKCITQNPNSFPPIVINITDGESTDGNPTKVAEELKALSTNDGNVLLFNVHISSHKATPIEFPDQEDNLPDEFAKLLFRMSSILPKGMRDAAQQEGYQVTDQTRGFVFNADMVALIHFLGIGTRPANLG